MVDCLESRDFDRTYRKDYVGRRRDAGLVNGRSFVETDEDRTRLLISTARQGKRLIWKVHFCKKSCSKKQSKWSSAVERDLSAALQRKAALTPAATRDDWPLEVNALLQFSFSFAFSLILPTMGSCADYQIKMYNPSACTSYEVGDCEVSIRPRFPPIVFVHHRGTQQTADG